MARKCQTHPPPGRNPQIPTTAPPPEPPRCRPCPLLWGVPEVPVLQAGLRALHGCAHTIIFSRARASTLQTRSPFVENGPCPSHAQDARRRPTVRSSRTGQLPRRLSPPARPLQTFPAVPAVPSAAFAEDPGSRSAGGGPVPLVSQNKDRGAPAHIMHPRHFRPGQNGRRVHGPASPLLRPRSPCVSARALHGLTPSPLSQRG